MTTRRRRTLLWRHPGQFGGLQASPTGASARWAGPTSHRQSRPIRGPVGLETAARVSFVATAQPRASLRGSAGPTIDAGHAGRRSEAPAASLCSVALSPAPEERRAGPASRGPSESRAWVREAPGPVRLGRPAFGVTRARPSDVFSKPEAQAGPATVPKPGDVGLSALRGGEGGADRGGLRETPREEDKACQDCCASAEVSAWASLPRRVGRAAGFCAFLPGKADSNSKGDAASLSILQPRLSVVSGPLGGQTAWEARVSPGQW